MNIAVAYEADRGTPPQPRRCCSRSRGGSTAFTASRSRVRLPRCGPQSILTALERGPRNPQLLHLWISVVRFRPSVRLRPLAADHPPTASAFCRMRALLSLSKLVAVEERITPEVPGVGKGWEALHGLKGSTARSISSAARDIPRPLVGAKGRHRFRRNVFDLLSHPTAKNLHKMRTSAGTSSRPPAKAATGPEIHSGGSTGLLRN